MNYWWVNQNKTYEKEVEEGFLWAPKKNKIGKSDPSFNKITEIKPGDIIFSCNKSIIKAIGIATSETNSFDKPNYEKSSEEWNTEGWLVNVNFKKLENQIEIKSFYSDFENEINLECSPFCKNGNIKQRYLIKIDDFFKNKILDILDILNFNFDNYETKNKDFESEKLSCVYRRVGQEIFKKNIYKHEKICRITGISNKNHLIASHIKPWCESTNEEKISEFNGLLLAPHIDHLFDKGFISFDNEGNLLISNKLDSQILQAWGLERHRNVGHFKKEQIKFLEYHRKKFNFE